MSDEITWNCYALAFGFLIFVFLAPLFLFSISYLIARHKAKHPPIAPNDKIAIIPRTLKRFRSMFDLPVETANSIYNFAYVVAIVGAAATAASTLALFWTGGIKERVADKDSQEKSVQIETLRNQNLKLEESLSRRYFKDQLSAQNELAKFEGTKVVIEYLRDLECERCAEEIGATLEGAKWRVVLRPAIEAFRFHDGVTVSTGAHGHFKPLNDPFAKEGDEKPQKPINGEAVDMLVEQLNKTGIEANGALRIQKSPKIPPLSESE